MEKNKRNSEEKVFQRENLHASFVNEMQCCDANEVDQNKSTNLEQLKTIATADGDYSFVCSAINVPCVAEPTGNNQITHNSHITSSFSDDELTQVKATARDNTYAEVAARLPPPAKITVNRRRMVWLVGKHQRKAANMLRIKEKMSRD